MVAESCPERAAAPAGLGVSSSGPRVAIAWGVERIERLRRPTTRDSDSTRQAFTKGWQGRSLLRKWQRERIYFFSPWSHKLFGFREGDMKFLYNARQGRIRAFDLAKDPREKNNILSTLPPGTSDEVKRKLAAWTQYQAKVMKLHILK